MVKVFCPNGLWRRVWTLDCEGGAEGGCRRLGDTSLMSHVWLTGGTAKTLGGVQWEM